VDSRPSSRFCVGADLLGLHAGADSEDGPGVDRGAVCFFDISTVTENTGPTFPVTETQKIAALTLMNSERFGWSVAVGGEFVVVGALDINGLASWA